MRPSIPKPVKFLLLACLLGTLLPFQGYLGLSYAGLANYCFWQPLTYFFTCGGPGEAKVFSLLINAYMIWVFGSAVYMRKGAKGLLTLFIGGGLVTGILCSVILWLFPSATFLIGATPAVYALLMGWLMLHSDASLRLFFSMPMRASWIILGIMGIGLFIDLSNSQHLSAISRVAGVAFGYLYALIAWKCRSPFQSLQRFENLFLKRSSHYGSKIYDFKTGREVVSDDLFIEACLEKISRYGKKSLTFYERWRLFRASKKQTANHKK